MAGANQPRSYSLFLRNFEDATAEPHLRFSCFRCHYFNIWPAYTISPTNTHRLENRFLSCKAPSEALFSMNALSSIFDFSDRKIAKKMLGWIGK